MKIGSMYILWHAPDLDKKTPVFKCGFCKHYAYDINWRRFCSMKNCHSELTGIKNYKLMKIYQLVETETGKRKNSDSRL